MNRDEIASLNKKFKDKSVSEIIEYAIESFGINKLILATSFSIEDQVLTDFFAKSNSNCRIFFIDTGRHFESTYNLFQQTKEQYKIKFEIYAPNNEDLEKMVNESGPNLFYESIELRKRCCEVRKVIPLKRVLRTVDAWICGLRKEQSPTRSDINIFEWDEQFNIVKINPLANWKEEDVWEYIRNKNIPYSKLYEADFRSIGCQPCTRAVAKGEDLRSGRWWWETPDKKECGLHQRIKFK